MHLLTSPLVEPVTVAEAKLAARIDDAVRFDAMLPSLIAAARQVAEQEIGRQIMSQVWRIELADWPTATDELQVYQATAAAVSYWDGSAWIALSGAAYMFGALGAGTALAPVTGSSWPVLGARPVGPRVRIDLTAGAATAAEVPDCVKLYIKAMVSFWLDNASAVTPDNLRPAPFLRGLLDPVRLWA